MNSDRTVGRRQSDQNSEYMRQLEACLAKSDRVRDVLQSENIRLQAIVASQNRELAKLRILQADVLTAAIEAGFDGLPKPSNQTEGSES